MLSRCATLLGRWKSWDHIKGRRKSAGSIHIRHTMGSKGRYKRLSTVAGGVREGRRHGANHMQGGLGVKLGGGLFGLRVPRQHALSTMTKDDFELEVHGHPNITNPYRDMLDEHPDLTNVVRNASLRSTCVVALPPISRDGSSQHVVDIPARTNVESHAPVKWRVPKRWMLAVPHLVQLATTLETLPPSPSLGHDTALTDHNVLVLATTQTSISLAFDREGDHQPEQTKEVILRGLSALFEDFASGIKVVVKQPNEATTTTKLRFGGRLFSDKMLRPPAAPCHSTAQVEVTRESEVSDAPLQVEAVGVAQWIRRLQDLEPESLRVRCQLPLVSARNRQHPPFEPSGKEKHDAEAMDQLMRWYVYNNDPRSHFNDLASRSGRALHLHTVVECLCPTVRSLTGSGGQEEEPIVTYRSIIGDASRLLMERLGFRITRERPSELFDVVRRWGSMSRIVVDASETRCCDGHHHNHTHSEDEGVPAVSAPPPSTTSTNVVAPC